MDDSLIAIPGMGKSMSQLKDNVDDKWYTIKSVDDLFKYGIDEVDYKLLNDKYIRFTILESLDTTAVRAKFNKLMEEIKIENM